MIATGRAERDISADLRGALVPVVSRNYASLTDLAESGALERVAVLDWTRGVIAHYARIRTALEKKGKPIGNMDLLIASHAVSEGYVVVTNNVKHFSQVPGLKVELWQ